MNDYKWGIQPADILDDEKSKMFRDMYRRAKSMQDLRTRGHDYFSKVSHMQNLYEHRDGVFSEGSTQAIKRKIRSETIQRVPDGDVQTQFDKNSIEQIETEFIFRNKVLTSEYDGKDMLKNLWRTFDASYDYGYGCVRTGFEKDKDGDYRISYKLIQWNDILPAPDCDFIEEAQWYLVREYLSKADLRQLINEDGEVTDSTYNADVVKYLVENELKTGQEPDSIALADKRNGAGKTESVVVWTLYKRGESSFETFCPACDAILRTVQNYDPRYDIPLHFLILEPDPDFPLGCSSIMWTLSQQQFADAFQTTAYQTLLMSLNPPLMQFGNLTNAKIKMKPRTIWNMGTNPNNKIEKFPVETTTVTQYNSILQGVSAGMMKNLNVTESTVASDANTMNYSGTPQGVEQQRRDKTTTVNQYQKRVETFFAEWANHALRSYINAMSGTLDLTVNEDTRRRIWDVESANAETDEMGQPLVTSIIKEDKISIDFDKLSDTLLEFKVRTGSLIQGEREEELENIQKLLVPVSQMMGNVSDQNRDAFENVLMQLVTRMCELSNIDVSAQTGSAISSKIMENAMQATMEKVMQQQQQIDQLMQAQQGMPMQPGMQQAQPGIEAMPPKMPMPGQEAQMPPQQMATPPQPAEVSAEFPESAVGLA